MILIDSVIEYDIKSAGLSVLYEKKAISKKTFKKIYNMDKDTRVYNTGMLLRNNKGFYEILKNGIKEFVELFIKTNKVKKSNVLEIANDAVWLARQRAVHLKFGNNILFVEKRKYTSIWKIKKNLYVYYNSLTGELLSRGFHIEKDKYLYDKIREIMSLYENGKDVYNLVHDLKDEYEGKDRIIQAITNKRLFNLMIMDFIDK